jgi:hypothetical protein
MAYVGCSFLTRLIDTKEGAIMTSVGRAFPFCTRKVRRCWSGQLIAPSINIQVYTEGRSNPHSAVRRSCLSCNWKVRLWSTVVPSSQT